MLDNKNDFLAQLPYMVTWESELECMCGQADRFGNIETGGECYGLFSHGGRLVIMLVTPSGPNAVHQRAHFRQDMAFLERSNKYLVEQYGLNFIGTHHSHHTLGIEGLSSGDIRSTHAISTKNGYRHMCQILLTFVEPVNFASENANRNAQIWFNRNRYIKDIRGGRRFSLNQRSLSNAPCCSNHSEIKVKIHPFIYRDAQNGQPVPCTLKLIPGLSPIRRSLKYDTKIPELRHHYRFSRSNMIYDSSESREDEIEAESFLPPEIIETINTLPENILRKMQLRTANDLLFIVLPLEDDMKHLSVVYETTPPYPVKMISMSTGEKHTDVTNQIFSSHEKISLMMLYQRCERFIRLSTERGEKSTPDETTLSLCYSAGGSKVRADEKQHIRRESDEPE